MKYAALLSLSLCACASAQVATISTNPSTPEEKLEVQRILIGCQLREAPKYDDKISDAATIGAAVARACTREGEASFAAQIKGESQANSDALRKIWPTLMNQLATSTVLHLRVSK